MSKEHKIIVALIVLFLVTMVTLFSREDPHEKIKEIANKLEAKADSLITLQKGYDSLRVRYDSVHARLRRTSNRLHDYQSDVDSIMASNISSVADLKSALGNVIENQPDFQPLNPDDNDDLF